MYLQFTLLFWRSYSFFNKMCLCYLLKRSWVLNRKNFTVIHKVSHFELLKIENKWDVVINHINLYQDRIFLSYSSQCETSEMRVSIERPRKKMIIMRICSLMRIRSSSLDQEADAVWVMSLNFAHLFVMRIHIYNAYSCACAKPQEIPIMHLWASHF